MIHKKHLITLLSITSLSVLTACAPKGPTGAPPETALNQICVNLKQQIIMDQNNSVPQQLGSNPAKEAALYKGYDEHNCDEILGQMQNTGITSHRHKTKHQNSQ